MADPTSTPRITSAYLDSFINKTIRITGRVTQLRGTSATIDAEGAVTLLLNQDSHLATGNAVEVVGKVNPDLSVKVLKATDMGSGVDFGLTSAVVDVTHRYKDIFYE